MSINEEDVEISLIRSIATSDLRDVAVDLAEIALDSVLEEGLAKDIPVVGTLYKVYKSALTVRDKLLLKKILLFLSTLHTIPLDQRESFLKDIESDNQSQKIGETLLLLLEKHDSMSKPQILAKVFAGYVKGFIDYFTFLQLARAIDQLQIEELVKLESYYEKGYHPQEQTVWQQFAQCGLAVIRLPTSSGIFASPIPIFRQTTLGETLIRLLS